MTVVDADRLARENSYVLIAVQALRGLIAHSVESVALEVGDERLVLRFWTNGNEVEVAEDADDAAFEMSALLPYDNIEISSEVHSGNPPIGYYEWAGRVLYRAKPSVEDLEDSR